MNSKSVISSSAFRSSNVSYLLEKSRTRTDVVLLIEIFILFCCSLGLFKMKYAQSSTSAGGLTEKVQTSLLL